MLNDRFGFATFAGRDEAEMPFRQRQTRDLRDRADLMSTARADQLAEAILYAIQLARRPETAGRCREWASQWSLDRVGAEAERVLSQVVIGHKRQRTAGKPRSRPAEVA